jgi:hypothetical protein
MAKNASPSYEQMFYMGGTGVSGIRNLSASYSVGQKQVRILGAGFVRDVIAEPLQGEVSMTRDLLYQDPFLNLTGEAPVSGTLLYGVQIGDGNEKVYGFNTGYLTSYAINCNVQDVPTVDTTFTVFGQMGSGARQGQLDYSGTAPLQTLGFVNHESVFLTFNGSGTNRAVSAAQTYETANMIDNIRSGSYQTIGVEIRLGDKAETLDGNTIIPVGTGKLCLTDNSGSCLGDDGDGITRYEFMSTTGHLVSESIESTVDGLLSVNLQFKDYYNKD